MKKTILLLTAFFLAVVWIYPVTAFAFGAQPKIGSQDWYNKMAVQQCNKRIGYSGWVPVFKDQAQQDGWVQCVKDYTNYASTCFNHSTSVADTNCPLPDPAK